MRLCFDSIEEVKAFVAELKGTRGGKKDKDEGAAEQTQAPAPLQPPQPGQMQQSPQAGFGGTAGFPGGAQPGPGAGQAFPGSAAPVAAPTGPQLSPAADALIKRINMRIDGALQSGQPLDGITGWFRNQIAPVDAGVANASLDQIKAAYLAKLSEQQLAQIAQFMNA